MTDRAKLYSRIEGGAVTEPRLDIIVSPFYGRTRISGDESNFSVEVTENFVISLDVARATKRRGKKCIRA